MDLDKYPKGGAPKVLIPKGGELTFQYETENKNSPLDPAMVVGRLLAAQAASSNADRFRREKDGQLIHVIPTAVKDSSGKLRPNKSVLDALITLPEQERTGLETLEALCAAIGKVTQTRVEVGTTDINLRRKYRLGANGQAARKVLVDLFEMTPNRSRLSWRLLYGPGTKTYSLNIHLVH